MVGMKVVLPSCFQESASIASQEKDVRTTQHDTRRGAYREHQCSRNEQFGPGRHIMRPCTWYFSSLPLRCALTLE